MAQKASEVSRMKHIRYIKDSTKAILAVQGVALLLIILIFFYVL